MGLVLKHVKRTTSGSYEYRRRVPKDVAEAIPKREFKAVLGSSEAEALRKYLRVHNEVEREIATARRRAVRRQAAQSGDLGGRALWEEAEERVAQLLAGTVDPDAVRDIIADNILASFARGPDVDRRTEGEPEGVPEVDRLTVNLLRHPSAPPPPPTLQDAFDLYAKDKLDPAKPDEHHKATTHLDRVRSLVQGALGTLPVLLELRREDARKVRDHMLAQRKKNGQPISASSAQRNLTIVRSVVNHALREMDLKGTLANPFAELPVKGVGSGRGNETPEADKRLPLPAEVIAEVRSTLQRSTSSDLPLIWRMLDGTGCRLAEVTGLRVEDVTTEGELPNIRVTWHEDRRLKGKASIRHVPLVGDALEAAKEAVELAGEAHLLFARYGHRRGSDAASMMLMKYVRAATTDPRHVVHSLRHNMKDRLIEAEVASLEQNLILGHALGSVGDRVYGGDQAKLRATTRALKKALKVSK